MGRGSRQTGGDKSIKQFEKLNNQKALSVADFCSRVDYSPLFVFRVCVLPLAWMLMLITVMRMFKAGFYCDQLVLLAVFA